jgi:hypothetical protein
MDKLIITIVSIAITAASVYAGTDYLTGFYRSAQARAKAQVWVSDAAQIAVAAKNAGFLASGSDDWSAGTASYLVPNYLKNLPQRNGSYVFYPAIIDGADIAQNYSTGATMIISDAIESPQVCQEIQKLGNRGDMTLTDVGNDLTSAAYVMPKNANQPFVCVWGDLNSNAVTDEVGTDIYFFIYRVFLDRSDT